MDSNESNVLIEEELLEYGEVKEVSKPIETNAKPKERNSNLELFRIITMILIVAHHYVVNSGLLVNIYAEPTSWRSIFLLLFGAWGKTGINCFVLITGYFMCKSNITLKKFLKLALEYMFYKIVVAIIFWVFGILPFNLTEVGKVLLPIRNVNDGFIGCYLIFFLTIPFLNILVKNATEKQHILLIVLSLLIYIGFETLPAFTINKNYVGWFIVLYFVSSYIRMYSRKIFDKTGLWLLLSIISVVLSAVSVVACAYLTSKGHSINFYRFVTDSNTFLAFTNGLTLFLLFKNIKMKNSKFINIVASTMLGVLCLHANSDAMRNWLWGTVFNNVGAYGYSWMPLHAIGTILIVFVVCVLIDLIRIYLIEKPFFKLWDKLEVKIKEKYQKLEDKVCEKHNIQR